MDARRQGKPCAYLGVPYRDDFSANQEQVHQLRRELEETRAELAELRVKYAKARAVLRVVAEGKKIANLLEEQRKVIDEIDS